VDIALLKVINEDTKVAEGVDKEIGYRTNMHELFVKMQNPDHCLHQLLPPE